MYIYRERYLYTPKKRDLRKARCFSNMFRFIDSFCAINDHLEFD